MGPVSGFPLWRLLFFLSSRSQEDRPRWEGRVQGWRWVGEEGGSRSHGEQELRPAVGLLESWGIAGW